MQRRPRQEYRQIDLFMLSCLVALVKDLNVSSAARRMGISQPGMSQVLSRLRELLGDPLLVRGAGTMLPTSRALQLAQTAEHAVDLIEDSFWIAPKFNPTDASRLFSIMASDYIQTVFFPHLLHKLL